MTIPPPQTDERWLVVSRTGRDGLHHRWLKQWPERRFDLLLSAYHPDVADPGLPGVTLEFRPGRKVDGYAALFRDRPDLLDRYDRIALIDDDIDTDTRTLNRCFEICTDHDLKIGQPALSHDSHFTYAALLQQPALQMRFVNFVEMMCPVFRADVLGQVLPLFDMGYESGIDLIWCNLWTDPQFSFGVIDACPVHHTRPVGTAKAANGFGAGRRYEDDITDILNAFGLPWLPCLPYGAVDRSGRMISAGTGHGRLRLCAAALSALGALPGPGPRGRLRKIMVHWNHLLRRKARNLTRALPPPGEAARRSDDLPAAVSAPASSASDLRVPRSA